MRKPIAMLLCCLSLFGVACGGDDEPAEPAGAPDEVTGVLLDVESEGVGEVTSFKLKEDDETYEIFIDENVDYGFNLGHLNEHLTTGDPVRVPLEERDGKLYAQAIEDA
ncbi:MAG TPA: hypothetical protein VHI71_00840 [Actinomycetota bacterium]|nr:hypothetical protein [Actinomycetota bacterium]